MSSNEEIISYIISTPENTNPNVLRGMLENSSGSGDFTTAKLTVTAPPTEYTFFVAPFINEDGSFGRISVKNGEIDVILYKGNASLFVENGESYDFETTGDISGSVSDGFTITGDCAITVLQNVI